MKTNLMVCMAILAGSAAAAPARGVPTGCDPSVMGEKYWELWNEGVQRRIDADIERYRKADGRFAVKDAPDGTEVRIEQVSHEFLFGAHSFKVTTIP